jgi:hypothetical protein
MNEIKKMLSFLSIILVMVFMFTSCKESSIASEIVASGIIVNFEGCKEFNTSPGVLAYQIEKNKECIEYEYNSRNTLYIKHINAGFNCCPGEIVADIDIENNEIIIIEKETNPSCYCQCLFDVNYKFIYIAPDVYTIKIIGPCHQQILQEYFVLTGLYIHGETCE